MEVSEEERTSNGESHKKFKWELLVYGESGFRF